MAHSREMNGEALSISVIMPAYNAADLLPTVLPPLIDMQHRGEIAEVIVVDDQSTDDSLAVARRMGARVLQTPKNSGPGRARNIGAAEAIGDVLWFIDADVVAHPGGAALLAKAFADKTVSAVFGSYDDRPPASNFASRYKNLIHHYYHQRAHREAATFWSGCGAVRKTAYDQVGGFNVDRFAEPSIEDIDLGHRLRSKGGRILLLHDLYGTHLKEWTMASVIKTDIFKRALPWSRLILDGVGLLNDLNTSWAERIRAGFAGLLMLSAVLSAVGVSPWWLPFVLFGVAVLINPNLFRFFVTRCNVAFALLALAFHQVYYVYSSAVFSWCGLEALVNRLRGQKGGRPLGSGDGKRAAL